MMQPQRIAPGPAGWSCLTCKRRHKKCDLRRPVCERCEKGGFECLGYSHNRDAPSGSRSKHSGLPIPRPIPSNQDIIDNRIDQTTTISVHLGLGDLNCNSWDTPSSLGNEDVSPLSSSSLCLGNQPINNIQHLDHAGIYSESEMSMTQNPQPLITTQPPAKRTHGPIQILQRLFALYNNQIPYVPYHMSKTLLDNANFEDYLMSHCDRMMELTYFKPLQTQVALIRHSQISRLRSSSFSRWMVFIATKMIESMTKGDTSQDTTYDLWLCQLEQALRSALTENLAPTETQGRLGDWLKVIILKTMLIHSSNTYQALRNATPTFLQMLFSDPTLWPRDCDLTSVPLVNVITSRHHELAQFALLDITAAMAFGLPQQVEYNTSLPCPPNGSTAHEWIQSSPIEFLITLAEINACRDKSLNARDWKEIEHRLITWQVRPNEYDSGLESCVMVAWFAVQESWRHTLLVYLYMAVCGASSDDPRIQSSVRQIFSVIGTVKKQESSDASVPFFNQYLMAGICARSEKHRSLARQQLANISDITPRLMRAVDFVPVLDHLWHGVAAGGRPIKWGDYVRSREVALPVLA